MAQSFAQEIGAVRSKTCFKCKAHLPLSEFYKHPMMADGHLNKCKTCTRRDVAEHRQKHIEKIREYDRSRDDLPHRVAARKAYAMSDRGKELFRKSAKQWILKNPEKRKAHTAVMNTLRRKQLVQPCQQCGETKVQAHHPDYTKPLDVVWLCVPCHARLHKEEREKKRQMMKMEGA